jgi:hypothetical protein
MEKCEQCGNEYERSFQVVLGGSSHVFDSFECAIEALAPRCAHCSTRIIGHGMQAGEELFCCASCARQAGKSGLKDRAS